jgi:uncharacterized Zn finger protein
VSRAARESDTGRPSRRWWSQQWVAAVEQLPPALSRQLQRGQALARRGAVEQVRIEPGHVTGSIVDEQPRAHRVELVWPVAGDDAWEAAVEALAEELRFVAALLEGDLPEEAGTVLADAGVELVPDPERAELHCPCRVRQRPCRHGIALWMATAAMLDRDVFTLLRLRGRDEAQLLDALRAHRGATPRGPIGAGLDLSRGLYAAHGDLEEIELHPAPVEDPAALFRQLGEPPGVEDTRALEELIARAASTAWRLAAGEGSQMADEELLLAELRAQRVATPASLAEALGRDPEELAQELDRLFEDGTVMRTGSGDRARYRAAVS